MPVRRNIGRSGTGSEISIPLRWIVKAGPCVPDADHDCWRYAGGVAARGKATDDLCDGREQGDSIQNDQDGKALWWGRDCRYEKVYPVFDARRSQPPDT